MPPKGPRKSISLTAHATSDNDVYVLFRLGAVFSYQDSNAIQETDIGLTSPRTLNHCLILIELKMVAVCFLNTESLNLHFTRNLNIAAYGFLYIIY